MTGSCAGRLRAIAQAFPAFLLVFALCGASARPPRPRAPAKPAPAPQAPADPLELLQQQIEAGMTEVEPTLSALDKLRARYPTAENLEALEPERQSARQKVQDGVDQMRDQLQEFRTLRKEDQFKRGTMIISKFLSGEEGAKVEEDLKAVLDMGEFPHKVQRFISRGKEALLDDQKDFHRELTRRKTEKRQRLMMIFGGLGAGGLAAFVLFLVRLRRQLRPKTVVGVPVYPGGRVPSATPPPGGPAHTPMPALRGATPRPALLAHRAAPPVESVRPGQALGSYTVVKELGKGSLGQAYEATETGTGRRAVVKRIREELHRTDKDLERFLAAARHTATLKHPNLAEVYAVFLDSERVHLALELVDGASLLRFLDTGRRINFSSIKRVLGQVSAVLEHAHSQRILHGDLKPSNIMVTRDGTAKVLDFGIGLEARKTAAKLSWSEALGSPAYMAPEAELGTTFRESDVYSLGVVFYEMLTGRLPFEGPNFLAQKREMRYPVPSRLHPGLGKDIDGLVQKALQAEPQYRFRRATELYAAISALPEPQPSPGHG